MWIEFWEVWCPWGVQAISDQAHLLNARNLFAAWTDQSAFPDGLLVESGQNWHQKFTQHLNLSFTTWCTSFQFSVCTEKLSSRQGKFSRAKMKLLLQELKRFFCFDWFPINSNSKQIYTKCQHTGSPQPSLIWFCHTKQQRPFWPHDASNCTSAASPNPPKLWYALIGQPRHKRKMRTLCLTFRVTRFAGVVSRNKSIHCSDSCFHPDIQLDLLVPHLVFVQQIRSFFSRFWCCLRQNPVFYFQEFLARCALRVVCTWIALAGCKPFCFYLEAFPCFNRKHCFCKNFSFCNDELFWHLTVASTRSFHSPRMFGSFGTFFDERDKSFVWWQCLSTVTICILFAHFSNLKFWLIIKISLVEYSKWTTTQDGATTAHGAKQVLTFQPEKGYIYIYWSGNEVSTSN